jgi:hypothetical protein
MDEKQYPTKKVEYEKKSVCIILHPTFTKSGLIQKRYVSFTFNNEDAELGVRHYTKAMRASHYPNHVMAQKAIELYCKNKHLGYKLKDEFEIRYCILWQEKKIDDN